MQRLTHGASLDNAVRGTSSGHREITLYVPAEATRLVFGLVMTGRGEGTAHGLRMEASGAQLPIAAARELDSAIALVRANALWRNALRERERMFAVMARIDLSFSTTVQTQQPKRL